MAGLNLSTISQPSIAGRGGEVGVEECLGGEAVRRPRADPALNPNQPNHRMPVPSMVNGRLWGGIASLGQPFRLPMMSTTASAATPALMWTTAPPAKSRAPRLNSHPFGLNTQWATVE